MPSCSPGGRWAIPRRMLLAACADRLGLHSTDWGCVLLLNEALPEPLTVGQLAESTGADDRRGQRRRQPQIGGAPTAGHAIVST
jgi:hypothetical protein